MEYRAESVEIVTERLILRRFRAEDAPAIAEQLNDPEVTKSTHSLSYPFTVSGAEAWIQRQHADFESNSSYVFAVTDRQTGAIFGFICMICEKRDQRGELGYAYGRKYWGHGIATEATRAVIEFAFQVKNLHKVYARHFASNPASGRVMQKCGMRYEGTQLSHDFKIDHFEDVLSYGILNPAEK